MMLSLGLRVNEEIGDGNFQRKNWMVLVGLKLYSAVPIAVDKPKATIIDYSHYLDSKLKFGSISIPWNQFC